MENIKPKKALPLMIQGTCSNAGKSFIVAGLLRIFLQDGYKVCPFKSQNMALNSYITKDGKEMGRAQVMQAEAAKIDPDVRMNPILLKPTSDKGSQVIINGKSIGNVPAKEYFKDKLKYKEDVKFAYNSLAEEYDIIVIEGAGSPAEINLKKNDIVNMGMAEIADAPVIIVGDIDKGGVFAFLCGTLMLLEEEEKKRVKGTIINKFRGDKSILDPGIKMLEDIINIKTVGIVPFMKIDLDDEDSLSSRFDNNKKDNEALLNIAVIRLPRISNFTDFNPFEYIQGVNLYYVNNVNELKTPDMVIIPGTKNTIGDLVWLKESGLEAMIKKLHNQNIPIFGICGGYQMLGGLIEDNNNTEQGGSVTGLELLNHKTIFQEEKITKLTEGRLSKVDGIFNKLSELEFSGYEIHMGISDIEGNVIDKNIVNNGDVYGSYIHGLFDKENITKVIIQSLLNKKGLSFDDIKTFNIEEYKQQQYDILADNLRENLDIDYIYAILGLK